MRFIGPAARQPRIPKQGDASRTLMAGRWPLARSISGAVPNCSNAYVVLANGQNQDVQHGQGCRTAALHGVFEEASWDAQPQPSSVITITSIIQNEAPLGLYADSNCPASAEIYGLNSFSLLAENNATYNSWEKHQGRTYFISFTARSSLGFCEGWAVACIPASKATQCSTGDDDALYDSVSCYTWPVMRISALDWADRNM